MRANGILLGTNILELDDVSHSVFELELDPNGIERLNRREHYRVDVMLKGELAKLSEKDAPAWNRIQGRGSREPGSTSSLDTPFRWMVQQDRQPCLVRDLSIGGARVTTTSLAYRAGHKAVLDIALVPGEILRCLPCEVVEAYRVEAPPPFQFEVRLRFTYISGPTEAHLSRYIAQVQRELIQKGIKA